MHTDNHTPPLRLVFPALLLVLLLASLDQTIVSTALPTIAGEFGGLEHLSWIVSAYLLATTAVSPIYGKLGDLYGRKVVLQSAITLFLFGSALCGLSRNMGELIAFRAVQGLGGGGLIVVTMAAVGDVIAPRERGRYQGLLGAVFGVSTVVGPLVGGFLVEHLSWRWIFYVNLPVGVLAFAMLAWAFPPTPSGPRRGIDFPGAFLLAATLTGVVMLTSLGGTVLPWTSAASLGLAVLSLFGLAAFLFVEKRAEEPILPLGLFRNRVFSIASAVGFIVGLAMFGSVTYLPMYLQVVKGVDPATAGLQVTPMMGGMLLSSIASGQVISRVGRYKAFPIAGTIVMSVGLLLLSRLAVDTSTTAAALYMLVLGLGLGMVMQVLVLAVQNAVPYEVLGVATSGSVLFRSIGGSVGVSVFGALFASGLSQRLASLLGPGAEIPAVAPTAALQTLPAALREPYLEAFAGALHPVFIIAALLAGLAVILSLFLKEIPLRETARPSDIGDGFAVPHDATSLEEAERTVGALAERQNRVRWYEELARDLGGELTPIAVWLLSRIAEQEETASREALAAARQDSSEQFHAELQALIDRGLVLRQGAGLRLSETGRALYARIVERRRRDLARLLSAWAPEIHADLKQLIARVSRSFVAEPPTR